jgi:hypothetical protein
MKASIIVEPSLMHARAWLPAMPTPLQGNFGRQSCAFALGAAELTQRIAKDAIAITYRKIDDRSPPSLQNLRLALYLDTERLSDARGAR